MTNDELRQSIYLLIDVATRLTPSSCREASWLLNCLKKLDDSQCKKSPGELLCVHVHYLTSAVGQGGESYMSDDERSRIARRRERNGYCDIAEQRSIEFEDERIKAIKVKAMAFVRAALAIPDALYAGHCNFHHALVELERLKADTAQHAYVYATDGRPVIEYDCRTVARPVPPILPGCPNLHCSTCHPRAT